MSTLTRNNLCNALLLFALLLLSGCGRHTSSQCENIQPPCDKFSTGDIAFRLGRTLQSEFIAASGNGETHYSHIGIILFFDGACQVVHIEPRDDNAPDVICCEPIEKFFATDAATAGCVVRHAALTRQQQDIISACTQRLLDKKILFDHDYRLPDTTQMYCTELAEYIFSQVDISLSEGRRHTLPLVAEPLVMPSDIAQNDALRMLWSFSYDDLRPAR